MNIKAVPSASDNSTLTSDSSEIKSLEKQKSALELQLHKINSGKEDTKTKQDKIRQVNIQIQLIEEQIQQVKTKGSIQNKNGNKLSILEHHINVDKIAIIDETITSSSFLKNDQRTTSDKTQILQTSSTNKVDLLV